MSNTVKYRLIIKVVMCYCHGTFSTCCWYCIQAIYHYFFFPPRRCHLKSDNSHTIINIYPLAHIFDICALIFSSCALFTVCPILMCNGIPPLSRWEPPEYGRAVRKNTGPSKNDRVKLIQLHMYLGCDQFSIFRVSCSLHSHSSVAQDHLHTIYPAQPRSSSYPLSTYFCYQHPVGHKDLIHSINMPKRSQYSLISYTPIHCKVHWRVGRWLRSCRLIFTAAIDRVNHQ